MKAILTAILFGSLVNACSFRQTILNNLDWLAIREIEDTFDLNDDQIDLIEPDLKQMHTRLKTNSSKQIVLILKQLKFKSQSGLKKQDLAKTFGGFEMIRKEYLLAYSEPISKFLKSLSREQIDHYQAYLEEKNEPILSLIESKSFKDDMSDYVSDRARRLHFWFGELSKEQEAIVASHSFQNLASAKEFLKKRRLKQNVLISKIRESSQEELKTFFDQWAVEPNLRAKIAQVESQPWNQWIIDLIFDIHQSLSDEQRRIFHERLDEIAMDLSQFSSVNI